MNFILYFVCFAFFATSPAFAIDHASVSIYAVRSDTGEVLIDQNSGLSLVPSSCMKVVTTIAALQVLGTDYRFETHLEYEGWIDETQTLHGNLYIKGGGDPCLGSGRLTDSLSWEKQIETWASAIQNHKIQRIEGKIIGDATQWEKALAVPSWCWEDLGNYYGAGACALSFHENAYSLVFKPGNTVGDKSTILRTDPPIPNLTFNNEVTTGPEGSGDRACIYGSEFFNLNFVRGTVPAGVNEFVIQGSIPEPAGCCADLLSKRLQEKGVVIEGKEILQQNKRIAFHATYSPTLKEIVHWTNQLSINLYAEHLLKRIGEVTYNEGTTSAGIKGVTDYWKSQHVDLSGFNMADGSGLSRKNLITAKQLVVMLLKVKNTDVFPIFLESLPKNKGQIKAKSGYMLLVRSYAGFQGNIAFAILINNATNNQMIEEKITDFFSFLNQLSSTFHTPQ